MAWKNETFSNNLTLIIMNGKIGIFSKCLDGSYFCSHPVVPGGGKNTVWELMICADTDVLL